MKIKLHYLLLICSFSSFGQVVLLGQVGNFGDTEGIHIFNKTYQKYTITDKEGKFSIPVRLNDTLVLSAIQYQLKQVIITKKVLKNEPLYIMLETKVNELDEVYIGYKLTGNLAVDTENIKTTTPIEFDLTNSFKGLGKFNGVLPKDSQSEIGENELPTGVDILGLVLSLIPKKKKIKQTAPLAYSKAALELYFGNNFFTDVLALQPEDYERFIQFSEHDVKVLAALKTRDELLLLEQLLVLREQFTTSE